MNKDRHFYLYAKNHYLKTDVMKDLKAIYDHTMGHDLGNECDVMNKLLHLTFPYIKENNFILPPALFQART